jgi:hypothetical protein
MSFLGDFFRSLANRPPVVLGFAGSLLLLFGIDLNIPSEIEAVLLMAIPSAFGYLASRFTVGPQTGKTLVEGTLQSEPTPKQRAKANEILGNSQAQGTVIPPDLRLLAERYAHLLPLPYPTIVAQGGLVALELALKTAQKAAERPATYDEGKDAIRDLGGKL